MKYTWISKKRQQIAFWTRFSSRGNLKSCLLQIIVNEALGVLYGRGLFDPQNNKSPQHHADAEGWLIKSGWPHFRQLEPIHWMASADRAAQMQHCCLSTLHVISNGLLRNHHTYAIYFKGALRVAIWSTEGWLTDNLNKTVCSCLFTCRICRTMN